MKFPVKIQLNRLFISRKVNICNYFYDKIYFIITDISVGLFEDSIKKLEMAETRLDGHLHHFEPLCIEIFEKKYFLCILWAFVEIP